MIAHDRSRGKGLLGVQLHQNNGEAIEHILSKALQHSGMGAQQNHSLALGYVVAGLHITPSTEIESENIRQLLKVAAHILNDESDLRIGMNAKPIVQFADRSTMTLEHYQGTVRRLNVYKEKLGL